MQDPQRYESNKSVSIRDAAEFVPKIIKMMNWTNNQSILDYGCGAGSTGYKMILPQVEKYNGIMYSVDVSKKMLEFAVKSYSHPRIQYAKGEILTDFPFETVLFDNIFSIYVFHFVRDLRRTLVKLSDVMKPGARLGFTLVAKAWYFDSYQALGESAKWKAYMKNYQGYLGEWMNYEHDTGHNAFTMLLQESGLIIVHLEVMNRTFPFENFDTCLEFFLALNPLIDSIPKELLPEYKDDLRRLVTGYAGIPVDSQTFTLPYECVLAVVEKPLDLNAN